MCPIARTTANAPKNPELRKTEAARKYAIGLTAMGKGKPIKGAYSSMYCLPFKKNRNHAT
jgi:hypothetical protein